MVDDKSSHSRPKQMKTLVELPKPLFKFVIA